MTLLKSMRLFSNFNLLCWGLFYLKDHDTFSLIWFFLSLVTSLLLIIKDVIFITYYFFEQWKFKRVTNKDNKLKIKLFLTQQSLHNTGHICWFKDDLLHRENDLPAIEWHNGCKEWYWEGKKHRKNGPAVIGLNGYGEWWFEGKKHREDGPALDWKWCEKEWFIHGVQYTEEEFKLFSVKKKLKEDLYHNLQHKQKTNRQKI